MLILPDRKAPKGRVLKPQRPREWQQPNQKTRFRLRGKLNDGCIQWEGWFEDREDADAFLHAITAGSIHQQPDLWRLPTPWWHPDLGEELSYEFAVVTFLTTPTGSNQTFNIPSDWNSTSNTVEAVGAGGGGSGYDVGANYPSGGGGGAYAKSVNLALTPGGTATWQTGTGGPGATTSVSGTAGGDSWFNSTTMPSSGQTVGAQGASGGRMAGTGGGGLAILSFATGTGNVKTNGGDSGTSGTAPVFGCTGGGGAAGIGGIGANGGNGSGTATAGAATGGGGASGGSAGLVAASSTAGGRGGHNSLGSGGGATGTPASPGTPAATVGGAGGGGGTAAAVANTAGGNGAIGEEWDSTHGSGGGGGGGGQGGTASSGGLGGLYGGGGGGGGVVTGPGGGAGADGLVVVTNNPISTAFLPGLYVPYRRKNKVVGYTCRS